MFGAGVGAGCGVLVSAKGVLRCVRVVCALWVGGARGRVGVPGCWFWGWIVCKALCGAFMPWVGVDTRLPLFVR